MIKALVKFYRRKNRDNFRIRSKSSNSDYIVSVLKSNKHFSINLENHCGIYLSGVTTKSSINQNVELPQLVDQFIVKLNELKIDTNSKFIFNKSGHVFHGQVAMIANTLSEKGIKCS